MDQTLQPEAKPFEMPAAGAPPFALLRGIVKRYGGLHALRGVDLDIYRNEVLALVGDNGAGKSTLVRILSGADHPDDGQIMLDGRPVRLQSPRMARDLGIATMYQELGLVDCFAVPENIFLGRELEGRWLGIVPYLRHGEMRRRTTALLGQLQISLPSLDQMVSTLSGGQRQAIAISRLLLDEVRLIIMDEPMAALGVDEGRKIMELIRRLVARGISILIISHNLEHVFGISTRIAVMKNGRLVGVVRTAETSREEITSMIVNGRS
jgi:ABC-type sugar transport system ATPase subunit